MSIKVSVIMITYGHEKYILEAINGVLQQRCSFNVELIIADDKSPDNTEAITQQFLRDSTIPENFKVFYKRHHTNKGMNENYIWAASGANGEFIANCEGDDYWTDPYQLQKQVDFLEMNPDYVLTYGKCQPFNDKGFVNKIIGANRDLTKKELIKTKAINTMTACFRNVIRKYPKEMCFSPFGDLFIWSLLGHYGKGKFMDNIKPAMYRIHHGSQFSLKSQKKKEEMWIDTSFALYKYYNRIGEKYYAKYFLGKHFKIIFRTLGLKHICQLIFNHLLYRLKKVF